MFSQIAVLMVLMVELLGKSTLSHSFFIDWTPTSASTNLGIFSGVLLRFECY